MGFAQIQILGNAGRDPEMNFTPDGTAVTKFSVAVSKFSKNKSGEKTEITTWYNCTAWRALGEMISQHLRKGQMVFVQGELNIRQYTTKDGREGQSLDVTIDKFQFAGSGGGKKEEPSVEAGDLGELDDHPF